MGATDNRNEGLLPQLSDLNVQFLLISYSEMQSPNVIVTTIKMKLKTITCCSYEALNPVVSVCLLYTSPSPRDRTRSRMPSSA